MEEIVIESTNDKNGRHSMTIYQVFPGVTFIFHNAHIQSVHFEERKTSSDDIIEITHCREGRLECHIGEEFCYMAPGDLAIARTNSVSGTTYFPLRHYHGLTIQLDMKVAPESLSGIMNDVNIRPEMIIEKFCGQKGGFVTRANPSVEHIFAEIYSVPKGIQKGYFKIKALELFLFLGVLDIEQEDAGECIYTQSQVELAKKISQYMLEHNMDERVTLEQLEEYFQVSGTYIKKAFKGVYGVSVAAYIRTQKMESAAYMLEYTDKSILEIANEHGYDNGSKFANAFRSVKGVNPTEYRKLAAKK